MVKYRVGLIAFATSIMRNVEKVKHRPNGTNNPKPRLYIQHKQSSRTNRAALSFFFIFIGRCCPFWLYSYYKKNFVLFLLYYVSKLSGMKLITPLGNNFLIIWPVLLPPPIYAFVTWTVISDQCKTGRGRLLALVFLTITMWYNFLTICNMCHLFASAPSEQTQSIFCLPNLVCRFARSVGGKTRLQNSWTLNSAKQLPRDKTKQNAPQDTLRWLQNLPKVEGWGQNCASQYKPFLVAWRRIYNLHVWELLWAHRFDVWSWKTFLMIWSSRAKSWP